MTRVIAALLVASGVFGFAAGVTSSLSWTNRHQIEEMNKKLRGDLRKYKEALGVAKSLDEENDAIELSNKEIIDAILAKAEAIQASEGPGDPPVCVDADGMRTIRTLR